MLISEKIKNIGNAVHLDEIRENNYRICAGQIKSLNINITSRCNEKCIYCYFSHKGVHKHGRDIDEKLFYRITQEAADLGVADVGLYTTGEPFLNPNLPQYVAWCKKLEIPYVYVSTNGILCTQEKLKLVADAGLDSLKFSIGGMRTFLQHHGVDAFDLVKRNIYEASNYREKNHLNYKLYLYYVVTKYNQEEVDDVRESFKDYVDEIIFTDCQDGFVPLIGLEEFLAPAGHDVCLVPGDRRIPCSQLFNRAVIDETGWLCACCSCDPCIKVIDLNDIPLIDGLNSEQMCNLRKRHLDHDIDGTLCKICATGRFDKENMHAFHEAFEETARKEAPIDIRNEIKRRFKDNRI